MWHRVVDLLPTANDADNDGYVWYTYETVDKKSYVKPRKVLVYSIIQSMNNGGIKEDDIWHKIEKMPEVPPTTFSELGLI